MPRTRPPLPKIATPQIHAPVARPRLFDLLDRRNRHRLVWISGVAGAGKTTLVGNYLQSRKIRTAWYQVDAGDADPASFFSYLVDLGKSLERSRRLPPLPYFTAEYAGDLPGFTRRFFRSFFQRMVPGEVIVFDNVHEGAGTALDDVLRDACAETPAGMSVIGISRLPLPGSLVRWRVSGELLEIGWDDLRFNAAETEALVAASRVENVDATQLYCQVDGWAAGLMLVIAQQRRDGRPFGDGGLVARDSMFEYFAGEVFDRAPPETRSLLMRTSLLPEVTPEIAAILSGNPDAPRILDGIYRRNYFTNRKEQPHLAYQYHDLFRAFLRARLEAEFSAESVSSVRKETARVLSRTGRADAAGDLLASGGHWADLADLLENIGDELLAHGRSKTILHWLSAQESTNLANHPGLQYWFGMASMLHAPDRAVPWLERSVAGYTTREEPVGQLRSVCGLCEAIFYRFTAFDALDPYLDILARLSEQNATELGTALEARAVMAMVQVAYYRQPEKSKLRALMDRAMGLLRSPIPDGLRLEIAARLVMMLAYIADFGLARTVVADVQDIAAHESGPPARLAWWHRSLSLLFATYGDLRRASEHAEKALDIAREHGIRAVIVAVGTVRVVLMHWRGNSVGTVRGIFEEIEIAARGHGPMVRSHCETSRQVVLNLAGDMPAMLESASTAARIGNATGSIISSAHANARLALALCANDQAEEGLSTARAARAALRGTAFEKHDGWVGLTEADALMHLDRVQEACDVIRECLTLIAAEGAWGIPGLCFRDLAKLMQLAVRHGIEVPTATRIIRLFDLPGMPEDETWPWPLRIRVLGTSKVDIQRDAEVETKKKPPHRLLDMLEAIVCLGPEVTADRLAEAIWPDAEGDQLRSNLSASLHRLRKLLGREDAVLQRDGRIALNPAVVWTDIVAFERLSDHITSPDSVLSGESLQRAEGAYALYRGVLLQGESGTWTTAARERLRDRYQRVSSSLAASYDVMQDMDKLVSVHTRMIELEPASEPAYRRLMQCLGRIGKTAEARDVYQRCRRVLSSTLRVAPSAETVAVFEALGG